MSDIRYGLGCLLPSQDERDYQFSELVAGINRKSTSEFPVTFTAIENMSEIYVFDQEETLMCCACAVANSRYIYENYYEKISPKVFSPCYIYGNRCISTMGDFVYTGEGMYLKDAIKQLTKNGVCLFTQLPYIGTYLECNAAYKKYDSEYDKSAYPHRVSSYYATRTTKEIKEAIMKTGSILASFLVSNSWYDVKGSGIIDVSGSIEGAHAVLIVGWTVKDNEEYWIILNSWGKGWGDRGFGYVKVAERKIILEAYCIVDEVMD